MREMQFTQAIPYSISFDKQRLFSRYRKYVLFMCNRPLYHEVCKQTCCSCYKWKSCSVTLKINKRLKACRVENNSVWFNISDKKLFYIAFKASRVDYLHVHLDLTEEVLRHLYYM